MEVTGLRGSCKDEKKVKQFFVNFLSSPFFHFSLSLSLSFLSLCFLYISAPGNVSLSSTDDFLCLFLLLRSLSKRSSFSRSLKLFLCLSQAFSFSLSISLSPCDGFTLTLTFFGGKSFACATKTLVTPTQKPEIKDVLTRYKKLRTKTAKNCFRHLASSEWY